MKAHRLTDEQRTAACVMHLFAVLHFEERRPDVWWYRWCVEHKERARGFEAVVWWALRDRAKESHDIESADEWLAYVEFVHNREAAR